MSESQSPTFHFRPGDLVEVRSAGEILATLDQNGALDRIPFMPEMAACCGRRFQVAKRAHKTCESGLRRVLANDVVHLAGVRCDGSAHGGCQYQCSIFWKESWLKPVTDLIIPEASLHDSSEREELANLKVCDKSPTRPRYQCQATEIPKFSVLLRMRELNQFKSDWRSGNVGMREIRIAIRGAYDYISWFIYRFVRGKNLRQARSSSGGTGVHLNPGDLVRVKSRREIFRTVDHKRRTRGLELSIDMLRFCGQEFRVAPPVERIIDLGTGYLKELQNECIVLEGVSCGGTFMMCPHNYHHFWREDWLELRERVDHGSKSAMSQCNQHYGATAQQNNTLLSRK